MKRTHRIAAAGDNCIDYYRNTGKGYPGGNPVNVAVYLQRYGCFSSYIGTVGDDLYGETIRSELSYAGVDVSHLRTEHGSTAISYLNLVDGERVFDTKLEHTAEEVAKYPSVMDQSDMRRQAIKDVMK